jgi:hypothetical protein
MGKEARLKAWDATDTIGSIFAARRDLLCGVKKIVKGTPFSIEEADLLISLFGSRELGWDDLPPDKDGFVTYSELERFLVHNPSLLSRRIGKLAKAKPALLKITDGDRTLGHHFNSKRLQITDEGVRQIKPVWDRYETLSRQLLRGISPQQLATHASVNFEISRRIRLHQDGLDTLLSPESDSIPFDSDPR